MNRAEIPAEATVYIELGTKRPSRVAYAAFLPYKMLWVVTNGTIQRNFLWIVVRKSGIYVAFGGPHSMHTSYHSDGTFHWSVKGQKTELGKRPPLRAIREPGLVQSGTILISNEALEAFDLGKFRDKPVDKVVYLDNRVLPDWINYQVWAVPPFRHGAVPLHTGWPAQIHVVTHTIPWIEVIIYEQGNREGR